MKNGTRILICVLCLGFCLGGTGRLRGGYQRRCYVCADRRRANNSKPFSNKDLFDGQGRES